MFYYIVFVVLVFLAMLELVVVPTSLKKLLYVITTIFFILISGLRWNTGNDWPVYEYLVTNFDFSLPFAAMAFEKGFIAFVFLIVKIFGPSFTAYLIVFATLNIGIKSRFLYKHTNAVLLIPLLLWGTQTLADIAGVRQSLAIAICLLSVDFIIKRKIFPFVLLVLLANQIHTSTVIFYLAYPVYYARWSVKFKSIALAFSILMLLIGSANWLMGVISQVSFLGNYITEKIAAYNEIGANETYGAGIGKGVQLLLGIAKRLLVLPIILYLEGTLFKNDLNYKRFSNLFLFGNIIYFLVGDFLTMQRLATCFYIFEIVLLCMIFEKVRWRNIWFIFLVLYSLAKLVFTLQSAVQSGNGQTLLDPYIWIFSEDTYRSF